MKVRVVASKLSRKPLYLETDHALWISSSASCTSFSLSFSSSSPSKTLACLRWAASLMPIRADVPSLEIGPGKKLQVVFNTTENLELLSKLKATNVRSLEKVETSITVDEALELLKCSFMSKTALIKVFGGKVRDVEAPSSMVSWNQMVPALELLKASFTTREALDTVFGNQTDRSIPQASTCKMSSFFLNVWYLWYEYCVVWLCLLKDSLEVSSFYKWGVELLASPHLAPGTPNACS